MTATGFSETAVVTEQASLAAKLETFIGGVLNSNLEWDTDPFPIVFIHSVLRHSICVFSILNVSLKEVTKERESNPLPG